MPLLKSLKLPLRAIAFACAAMLLSLSGASAQSGPIKVGVGLALTGAGAAPSKVIQTALEIWRDDVNAKGGILGRPVQLVILDDQSNPANVPGIYTKLITVDKVDLLLGPYGTNFVAPAMPTVIQHNKLTISFTAIGINRHFNYNKYFSMVSVGPDGVNAFSKGFFEIAAAQKPKPQTVAILAADAEFARSAADGAREETQEARLQGGLRPELSTADHGLRTGDACDPGGEPRHPLSSAPIRPTTSASSAPPTRSGCRPKCLAAR